MGSKSNENDDFDWVRARTESLERSLSISGRSSRKHWMHCSLTTNLAFSAVDQRQP